MNIKDILCGNCHNQVMETSDSRNVPCQTCTPLISIEVRDTVPKGFLCFCWRPRSPDYSNPDAASPKPNQKTNPMTNNTGEHQTKRAVLCGVSYRKIKYKLKGTINDVNRMKSLLIEHFHFPETAICVLTDIPCGNCHNQVMVTPNSRNVRCPSCTALISIEVCVTFPKGPLCFRWRTRLQENSSPGAALPKPDQKRNPMTNNTGGHQTKRAVLCGVTYQKKKHKLKGTINDANRMKSLLTECFNFPETAICVLTEEESDPNLTPTKENMQKALRWLVADCKSGDSLVFYFSGHGLRQPDFEGDEIDGYDETICPSDFMTAGMILDNDINTTIVKPLKKGVKLHAIIDACHSGTILDLVHVYDRKQKKWVDNKPPSGVRKSTDGGLAISLSACADDQIAADTTAFSRNEMTGAMTYIFEQIIRQNTRITYGDLLEKMHDQIAHANRTGCILKLFRHKIIQETQLSSSDLFEVDKEEFNL